MKRLLPLLGFAVLAVACRPSAPGVEVVVPTAAPTVASPTPAPAATPTSRALPASAAPALPNGQVMGLVAQALGLGGAAIAGADVKVFRLGQPAPMAAGKSGTNGAFLVDLGAAFPADAPVQIVATKAGQTVVAMGTARIVAQGGGNIVAQGGGNIVAQGGGNIISTNGAGIVAQGGGNIISGNGSAIVAQGGGNFGLLDTPASPDPNVAPIDPASSLTWALLGPRFRGAGQALTRPGSGDVIRQDLANLNLAYNELRDASARGLSGASETELRTLLGGFDADGRGHLDANLSRSFGTLPGLRDAFQRAAIHTEEAITNGLAHGGTPPGPDTLQPIEFAGATADPINVSNDGATPSGENGARDPEETTSNY